MGRAAHRPCGAAQWPDHERPDRRRTGLPALDLRPGARRESVLLDYVDQGLPVNLANPKGDTLLILASYHGHAELAAGLLARGADTERVNHRGQTALVAAVFKQAEPIVRALLAAGADPHGGSPDAVATTDFFGLPAMRAILDEAEKDG